MGLAVPRSRYTVVKVMAVAIGASLALVTSMWDAAQLSSPNDTQDWQQRQLRLVQRINQAKLPEEPTNPERKGPKRTETDKQAGNQRPGQTKPAVIQNRPKPTPFTVDERALGPVVNPHPFKVLIGDTNMCAGKDVFLVIYVHTAPQNHQRRALVRETWGATDQYAPDIVKIFFMMGLAMNSTDQKQVEKESKEHSDIVQEDFVDAYHNISYKAVGAFNWVSRHCSHAKFVLKSDDDVFVNTFGLLKHFHDLDRTHTNTTGLLMCLTWHKMHVLREGKWNISSDVLPNEYYPPYCSGMGYIMTPDVAKALYQTSFHVPFFWVDDVYITGMLPGKINLTHVNIMRNFMGRYEIEWLMSGPDWYKYVFCHLHNTTLFRQCWNTLVHQAKTETIPDMPEIVAGKFADSYGPKQPPWLREKKAKERERERIKKRKAEEAERKKKGTQEGKENLKADKKKHKQEQELL